MKNLEQREGFINRNTNGLPKEKCVMKVVTEDIDGEHIFLCEWNPVDKIKDKENNIKRDGFLGSVKVIEGRYKGIGFNAWAQNNSEFVWYSVIYKN